MRARSVCSLHTARRAPRTPACWSSRPVRRVSSQQISVGVGQRARPPAATGRRGCRSAWRRGPAGRASSGSARSKAARLDSRVRRRRFAAPLTRLARGAAHSCGPSRSSTTSPGLSPQRSNAPASASITHDALGHRPADAVTGHAHRLDDRRRHRRRRRRRCGKRIPIVCTQRHDVMHERPLEPSRWSSPRRRERAIRGHLGRGEDAGIAHQPGHARKHGTRAPAGVEPGRESDSLAGRRAWPYSSPASAAATRPSPQASTGGPRARQHPRQPGRPQGGPEVPHLGGRYLDDLDDVAELDGRGPRRLRAIDRRPRHDHSIDTSDATSMPGVVGVFTAADLGLAAGPVAVQPGRRQDAAGQRPGPLRRRADRRRRRRDARAGRRRRRDGDRRLRPARRPHRPRGGRRRHDAPLRRRRQQRRVRLDGARHARPHRRRVLRRLRGRRSPGASSTSAWRRARSRSAARPPPGSTAACTSGSRRSTPRASRTRSSRPTASRPTSCASSRPDVGGGFGAKIAHVPRGDRARRSSPSASAARCGGRRRAASR